MFCCNLFHVVVFHVFFQMSEFSTGRGLGSVSLPDVPSELETDSHLDDDDADDADDDDEVFVVEKIVDMKCENGKKWYLVKWRGFDSNSNTWEPEDHVSHLKSKDCSICHTTLYSCF
jgi:hypothetical protein